MSSILIFFHCPSNTGYAIDAHERTFFEMARRLVKDDKRIHVAFTNLSSGPSKILPASFSNVVAFNPGAGDETSLRQIGDYVRANGIRMAFGVDQPVTQPSYRAMRKAGVKRIISYWGAPVSSLNSGLKLLLKRIEVATRIYSPDHYIFESKAMAATATHGRGIPASRVSVVYLGVDAEKFAPSHARAGYLLSQFGIPDGRHVVYYSGHMQERKGVRVLINAAKELVEARGRSDFHLLILGNRPGEDQPFIEMLRGSPAAGHVTFGGYRNDMAAILPNCTCGAIASTGWDSFTVSALEMAAAGLPVAVSNLQGLVETVAEGETGKIFPAGDHRALADILASWFNQPDLRQRYGAAARQRIVSKFTTEHQVQGLVDVCRPVFGDAL
jgi:glycosyltransferase involved in cell wall biosynthesis